MNHNTIRKQVLRFSFISRLCIPLVLGLASAPQLSLGQQITAQINGEVTDQSGRLIVGAKVVAKDVDRGVELSDLTNEGGNYSFPRLAIGRYEVRVESAGFKTSVQPNVVLQLNQVAKLDFQLAVGSVQQIAEVTSAAPILQTESTQLGTIIDARTNVQLPLATRNYNQLTLLAPGSVTTNPSSFTGPQATFTGGRPYINGNREQANYYLLDGIDNNQVSENAVGYSPSVDAIQEFNLITQNASAEFGNFLGGIISVSIKSGTNQFHGSAFEFFRNDILNANNWANNFQGLSRPLLRWNEFGGAVGGRIIRDKLFFFADYQGSRYDQPATNAAYTVLTTAERGGNFGALCSEGFGANGLCNNLAHQLYNPFSSPTNGSGRSPFLNNQIPITLFSPAASAIVNSALYPQPINGALINNQVNRTKTNTNSDQGDLKVDYIPSEKQHFFARYSQQNVENPTTNSQALLYNGINKFPLWNGVLNYAYTISPTFVNEARAGVNYFPVTTGFANTSNQNAGATFGIAGVASTFLPGLTFANGNLNSNGGIGNSNITQQFADTNIQATDTLLISVGKQTMHLGFQYIRQRLNIFYPGNEGLAGTFAFSGRYTGGGPGLTGAPEADFLLGLPETVGVGAGAGTSGQRASVYSAFFQDDWRVTSHVTLNLGLRYELHTPWDEVHNRQTNFGEFSGQIFLSGQTNQFNDNNALYNQYNGIANYQPRLGIAWSSNDNKSVLRASYTLSSFLEGTGTNLRLFRNAPWEVGHSVNYTSLPFPSSTLDQGFSAFPSSGVPCTPATIQSVPASCFAGATAFLWDPKFRPAVSNQYNLSVQHQFGNSTTLQVAYVGQRNTHLVVPIYASQKVLNPDNSVSPGLYLAGNPALQSLVGNAKLTATNGNQNYNALQVSVQRRLTSGLEFSANYTYSKCLTNSIGYYGSGAQSGGNYYYWQNAYDAKANYGPCYYDVTHSSNGFATYDLPFGHNRAFGKNVNKVVNAALGDWQINAIVNIRGGFPFTIGANDVSNTNSAGARASCSGSPTVFGKRNSPKGGYQYWDPSSFFQPLSGFGNCGIGVIRGPGLTEADLSVTKTFTILEHQGLELRAEAINFTNTPILSAPNSRVGSTLGLLQGSQGARNVQFGLKYNF